MSISRSAISHVPLFSGYVDQDAGCAVRTDQLFPSAPDPGCVLSVVIPARNEQDCLPEALRALAGQHDLSGDRLDHAKYEVLVLVNNTTDETASAALAVAESCPTLRLHVAEIDLPVECAHVGYARRLLMDAACHRLRSLDRRRAVIASTDADTVVSPTWVSATLAEVSRGADVVGGRIELSDRSLRSLDPDARLFHLRDVAYRYLVCLCESLIDPIPGDPWPRHFQHFGASVALTVDAYLRVGGLPPRSSLEDVALHEALSRIDARMRHSPHVRVTTSARMQGRTGFGFAVQLQQWASMNRAGQPFLVESADAVLARLHCQRRLRSIWRWANGQERIDDRQLGLALEGLESDLAIQPDALYREITGGLPFGEAMWRIRRTQRDAGVWDERYPNGDIVRATHDLRAWIDRARGPLVAASRSFEDVEQVQAFPPSLEMPQASP